MTNPTPELYGMKKFESESDKSFKERFQRFLEARAKQTQPWRLDNESDAKRKSG